MRVLSFDCGTQNLSWCLYDAHCKSIVDWQLQDITHPSTMTMNEFLFRKLDEWGFKDISKLTAATDRMHVVIEKQPFRNAICKNIEAALMNYFIIRGKVDIEKKHSLNKVCTYNPKHKLAGQKIAKGKKAYAERKQRSVDLVKNLDAVKNTSWNEYLQGLKKKDDACDALLQAIAYCQQNPRDLQIEDNHGKRIIARQPKTSDATLTPANCKFFLKQLLYPRLKKQRTTALERLPTEVAKNPRLRQAIADNFKSLDDSLRVLNLLS